MRCYICNRELAEKPTNEGECKAHGEHIIHNGIRGKLISRTILCEECGGKYSKEDSNFCKIFDPFIAALGNRLILADHGKVGDKVLKGSLFDTPSGNPDDPNRKVMIKNGVVAPIEPYYEIDGDRITLYAEKNRIDQYEKVVAKELQQEGKDITDFNLQKVTDIHDKGYLAYYFSKDNSNFNHDFQVGMVKIATEYALECGIPREQLKNVLSIHSDGTANIENDYVKIIPFVPTTLFDCVFEDYRYALEEGYPSHTLKLFSTKYSDGSCILYCYIDLFSTFQYYVVLNDQYTGEEISHMYSQRLLPKTTEKPDVAQYDPSDLDIIIREYGIDMSRCTANTNEGQLRYVQDCIRKYPLQTYHLQKALNRASDSVHSMVLSYLMLKNAPQGDNAIDLLAQSLGYRGLPASVKNIIEVISQNLELPEILQLAGTFRLSVDERYYRKFGFEVIEGDVMNYSQPDESMKVLAKCKAAAQEYTNAKFSHLSCLCYNPASLQKDTV